MRGMGATPRTGQLRGTKPPAAYSQLRRCLRAWIALSGRPLRILGTECLADTPAILRICGPDSFRHALVLIAASKEPLGCVIHRKHVVGSRSLLAAGLGMIPYDTEASGWRLALHGCTEVLASGGVALVFEEGEGADVRGEQASAGRTALTLAREAWLSAFPGQPPVTLLAHLFWPSSRAQEIVIHIGPPSTMEAPRATVLSSSSQREGAAHEANGPSVFALEPFIRLLSDLEQVLKEQLEVQWATRGRRQSVQGFRLSPLAIETVRSVNRTAPETLAALRESYDAASEAERRWSLATLRAERGRKQLSALPRILAWAESILGLPVAVYGILNHLIVGTVLLALGRSTPRRESTAAPWLTRSLVIVACYAGQIVLINHLLGRAAAAYYAIALPVSGAYLWRYYFFLQGRTRILLLGIRAATLRRRAKRRHDKLIAELDRIFDCGATLSGVH